MHENPSLLLTLTASILGAFIFGLIAKRLKLPSILGYLLAGVLIGPHTPGFIGNVEIAAELSDIGVILLMFGVGLHFSLKDLLSVRKIAIPGALLQVVIGTALGAGSAFLAHFSLVESIAFGFMLSISSTIVALRGLENRNLLKSKIGKISIGWLIVEDIVTVIVIVLLPVVTPLLLHTDTVSLHEIGRRFLIAVLKISVFAILMIVIGRRLLPGLLVMIAKTRSRELSSLGTLAIALGFAYTAYALFDASFALGAFLAGFVLNESEIGHKAAEQSLPLRDTFAVLFFVSAGMLLNPSIFLTNPLTILMALGVIAVGIVAVTFVITQIYGLPRHASLLIALNLAQIGEFSFIFAGMAQQLGIISTHLYDVVLASALLSIAVNPFLLRLMDWFMPKKAEAIS